MTRNPCREDNARQSKHAGRALLRQTPVAGHLVPTDAEAQQRRLSSPRFVHAVHGKLTTPPHPLRPPPKITTIEPDSQHPLSRRGPHPWAASEHVRHLIPPYASEVTRPVTNIHTPHYYIHGMAKPYQQSCLFVCHLPSQHITSTKHSDR